MESQEADRIIRLDEVLKRVALSKPALYRLEKAGKFPAGKRLSARAVGWSEREVDAWISALPSRVDVAPDRGADGGRLLSARREKQRERERASNAGAKPRKRNGGAAGAHR